MAGRGAFKLKHTKDSESIRNFSFRLFEWVEGYLNVPLEPWLVGKNPPALVDVGRFKLKSKQRMMSSLEQKIKM
jgi:hypothetical protein